MNESYFFQDAAFDAEREGWIAIQLFAPKDMDEAEREAIALVKANWEDSPKRIVRGTVLCKDPSGKVLAEREISVEAGSNTFWYAVNDCDPEEIGCVADMIEAEREARAEVEHNNWSDEYLWVTVRVEERDGDKIVNSITFKMVVGEPDEPDCIEPDHVFERPPFCKDNEEVCKHCGWFRAELPESEKAPAHIDWREPDSASLEWIEREHGMSDDREYELRKLVESTVRRAIRSGSDNVMIPADLFNLDDEVELEFNVTKTREDGQSEIEVELVGFDSWNESGDRQSDFLDDLIEMVVEGTIEHFKDLIAEHFAIDV